MWRSHRKVISIQVTIVKHFAALFPPACLKSNLTALKASSKLSWKAKIWICKPQNTVKIMRVDCPRWPAGQCRVSTYAGNPSPRPKRGYYLALNLVMCSKLQTENLCLNKSSWHIFSSPLVLAQSSLVAGTDKDWQADHQNTQAEIQNRCF